MLLWTTLLENRAAQTCEGDCSPIVTEVFVLAFAWGVYSGFVKLSSKGNRVVDSVSLRTPDLGQAVNQSAELRSSLVFFATAQSFRERSLESVN